MIINNVVDSSRIDMSVNREKSGQPPKRAKQKRVRRSPAQARDAILVAARARLLRHGIDGLKITQVARDAGMSHATLLHHFGSSDAMRRALVERMANALLTDFIAILGEGAPTAARLGDWLAQLFKGLSDERHAQLFAWFALNALDRPDELDDAVTGTGPLVAQLLEQISQRDAHSSQPLQVPRYVVLLVVSAAIGLGVAGPWLQRVRLSSGTPEVEPFAHWLAEFLIVRRETVVK